MTRRLAALATLAALTIPAPADAKDRCKTRSCHERVARKQCAQTRPVPCIRRAAIHWRVDFHMLLRKARCESGLRPWASNGVHAGMFQFNYPGTWSTTPYARRSPWRAKWSALAAGWMHHVGRGGEWSCR